MLEFTKIENLYETGQSDAEPAKETVSPAENKEKKIEGKEKLPHTIKANFEINPDGTIDIKTEYGILKGIEKDLLPDDLKNDENGKFEIAFTSRDIIAREMLNQLLDLSNKDE